jgi:heme a synthase
MTNSRITRKNNRLFRRLALLTVVVVYLLILIGGIVRSTGSGMGCPDWPKCFGSWVPPTEVSQLPPNYAEIYGAKLKGEVVFNSTKTWIEYLNRLFGVFTGLLIFGTLLASIPFLRSDKPVFYYSLAAFLLVGFQGWLGSKVVSTELSPVMVTIHMVLALVIVFLLLYVMARSYKGHLEVEQVSRKSFLNNWLIVTFILSMAQIVLGTQVREAMDVVMKELGDEQRGEWIENLGLTFYVHRSFSILILGLHIGLVYWLKKNSHKGILNQLTLVLLSLIVVEIVTGIVLAYFAVPAFAQPIHLTLATIGVGLQFVIWLFLNSKRVFKNQFELVTTTI